MQRGRNDEHLTPACLMAEKVAHDLSSLLGVMLGNLSLAMGLCRHEDKALEALSRSEQAALKIRDLAQQLLSFARLSAPQTEAGDVEDLVREAAGHLSLPGQVGVRFELPKGLWEVQVDPRQLDLALKIILANAVKAMPYGGEISIYADNLRLLSGEQPPLPAGGYVRLSLRDQGIGGWSKTTDHLKERGPAGQEDRQIMGLGTVFFLVDAILKDQGGLLDMESVFGRGTTFHLYLPALAGKDAMRAEGRRGSRSAKGRILLMDDEETVRDNLGVILQHLGYEVEFAREGVQALDLYIRAQQGGRPFDAVIIDLTIHGGMGGRETMERLLRVDPRARAIVFSGDPNNALVNQFQEFGFQGRIKKPYSIEEVSEVLHHVIH